MTRSPILRDTNKSFGKSQSKLNMTKNTSKASNMSKSSSMRRGASISNKIPSKDPKLPKPIALKNSGNSGMLRAKTD